MDNGQKLVVRVVLAAVLALSAAIFAMQHRASAEDLKQTPEAIKADLLLSFSRYVEWPEGALLLTNSPVMLGVYGNTPLLKELRKQSQSKRVNGRRIIVREYYWPLVPNCHVLFISDTERSRMNNILAKVQYASVLTISEIPDFAERGGMVQFTIDDERGDFSVNLAAATNAHLRLSARLLNVAKIVR